MNHYVVLGVPADADDRVIRQAFRSLVRRYHPDAGEGSSPEQFRLLMEAYETLMDPIRRRAYDRSLRPAPPAAPIPVEPLTAPIEPLAGWRQHAASGPLWSTRHLDEWFDELWTALEADLFYFRLPRR